LWRRSKERKGTKTELVDGDGLQLGKQALGELEPAGETFARDKKTIQQRRQTMKSEVDL